jgi:hypothetical protein
LRADWQKQILILSGLRLLRVDSRLFHRHLKSVPAPIAELLIDNIPDISVDTPQLISARASDAFGNAIIDSVGLEIIIESISGPALIEPDPPSAVLGQSGFCCFPPCV